MDINSVRYSVNRNEKFQIKTIIFKSNNKKLVKKEPYSVLAKQHVLNIIRNYSWLQNSNWLYVPVEKEGDAVIFPYIEGKSFDDELLTSIERNNVNKFKDSLMAYYKKLVSDKLIDFEMNSEFADIFGAENSFDNQKSLLISNIDVNFDNIIIDNSGKWNVIDYEWVFDFPVPVNFLFYRSISGFMSKYELELKYRNVINEIFESLNLSTDILIKFDSMEKYFTNYIGHNSNKFSHYLNDYNPLEKNKKGILNSTNDYLEIFWSNSEIFTEENKLKFIIESLQENTILKIELPDMFEFLRIDPTILKGIVSLKGQLEFQNSNINLKDMIFSTLDVYKMDNSDSDFIKLASGSNDPQLFLKHDFFRENGKKVLNLEIMPVQKFDQHLADIFNTTTQKIKEYAEERNSYKKIISDMKIDINNLVVVRDDAAQTIENYVNENMKLVASNAKLEGNLNQKNELLNKIQANKIFSLLKKVGLIKI